MTAQISDRFHYRKKYRSLAGVNGSELFDPAQQGVNAVSWSSACWRGFYCSYEVVEGLLFLTQVNLGLDAADMATLARGLGPKLFGKVPRQYLQYSYSTNSHTGEVQQTSWQSSDVVVDGLWEVVPFTGSLLLGEEFIWDLYIHMGFHPAYKFQEVHELVFEAAGLSRSTTARPRWPSSARRFRPTPLSRAAKRRGPILAWIMQCFSLKY